MAIRSGKSAVTVHEFVCECLDAWRLSNFGHGVYPFAMVMLCDKKLTKFSQRLHKHDWCEFW